MQEFLLLDFFLLRLLRLLRSGKAAALAAMGLFAIAHLPNPVLTALTVLWGWISCRLFLRFRNVYPLAMAHAILGISVAITVPGPIDHDMHVGLGYFMYHPRPYLQRSQADHTVSTHVWVNADATIR